MPPLKYAKFGFASRSHKHITYALILNVIRSRLPAGFTLRTARCAAAGRAVLFGIFLGAFAGRAQQAPQQFTPPLVLWQQALGGSAADAAFAVRNLPGRMLAIAGSTRSNDGMLGPVKPGLDLDMWLVKLNINGQVQWHQHYGGTYNDEARDVRLLPDGGFVLAGWTESRELSPQPARGGRDAYLVRTDALGTLLWQRTYGGPGNDVASVVLPLADGGFLLCGETGSLGGSVGKNAGGLDGWIIRTEADGRLRWEKTFGGKNNDIITAAVPVADGYILVGSTNSNDGDMPGNKGKMDVFVIKIDEGGNSIWRRNFGGTSFDEGHAVAAAPDGRIYIAGTTFSNDGDVAASNVRHHGGGDVWLLCLDRYGMLQWTSCYGGTGDEGANALELRKNGQLVVAATSRSRDGDRTAARGVFDGWLLLTDNYGKLLWEKTVGGFENDAFTAATEIPSGDARGEYLAVGYTTSKDGDLSGIDVWGGNDLWAVAIQPPQPVNSKQATRPAPGTLVSGYVLDKATGKKLRAEISINDNITRRRVASARTDTTGLFQIVLSNTTGLTIGAVAEGYMLQAFNLQISADEVGTEIVRNLELDPLQKDLAINLYHVYFESAGTTLRPDAALELERLANFMTANPGVRVKINGHTDNTGNAQSKLVLSQTRALAVKSFLMQRGIYEGRMVTEGYGMSRPIAPNTTEANRALNRRVEVIITATQ
jgi:outer membrane protein OmpA-like peptidoglycan-associated protein